MSARRFFVAGVHAGGDSVALTGADAHKIQHVLRLKSGDRIEVVDSAGSMFDAELDVGEAVRAVVSNPRPGGAESRVRIDVAQGIPKGQKMDFVVEKLTELGASSILPFESERSVARDVGAGKLERWRRLASSAAAQSGRSVIPSVETPLHFAQIVERFAGYDVVLFPWEVAENAPLRDVLPSLLVSTVSVLVVVGPEGGFSHDEADRAAAAGAHLISLGPRILRTETAALALLAILAYVAA